jgi:hypothetical protein
METTRNPEDGTITVYAKRFIVAVTEDGVKVFVSGQVVNEWPPEPVATFAAVPDRADQPSPRAAVRNRKRGSR